jgi:hypothetical protein
MAEPKLTDVKGIGPKTADGLMARGIDSIAALAAAPIELISSLPGFFASRSQAVKDAAGELVRSAKGRVSTTKKTQGADAKAAKKTSDKETAKKAAEKKAKAKKAKAKAADKKKPAKGKEKKAKTKKDGKKKARKGKEKKAKAKKDGKKKADSKKKKKKK